jgi:regulator of protease activity HflC (stomatin/prohibitin superfamily)
MKYVRRILSPPAMPLALGALLLLIGYLLNLDWWWYGGIFCALISYFLMDLFGMQLLSRYVLPLEPGQSPGRAHALIERFIAGRKPLMAVIREGKEVPGPDGKPRPAPESEGAILVDTTSVAVLVTDTGFSRIVGPGLHFTNKGEKLGLAIDLRPQHRVRKDVEAQTRDGIWIKFVVVTRFQIDGVTARPKIQEVDRSREPWPAPYQFSENFLEIMIALLTHQRAGAAPLRWDEFVAEDAVKRAVTYVSEYTFDELTEPRNPLIDRRSEIKKKVAQEVADAMKEWGIRVDLINIIPFVPRDEEIKKQRIESWQADWLRRSKVMEAEGDAEARRKLDKARLEAQADTIRRTIDALKDSKAASAELIALQFLEMMGGLAKDPETQRTIDHVRRKLLVSGGTTGGTASASS